MHVAHFIDKRANVNAVHPSSELPRISLVHAAVNADVSQNSWHISVRPLTTDERFNRISLRLLPPIARYSSQRECVSNRRDEIRRFEHGTSWRDYSVP
jgi:hypothetical protein